MMTRLESRFNLQWLTSQRKKTSSVFFSEVAATASTSKESATTSKEEKAQLATVLEFNFLVSS